MAHLPDVIEAGQLVLVRWRTDDVDEILEAVTASHQDLRQWMDWAQTVRTRREQLEALTAGVAAFDAGTDFGYVFRDSTGAVVGAGGAHRRIGPGAIEIGYWVRSDRHRHGYATAAAGALTDAVFDHLPKVERVEIHMDRANAASARIPEKLGYRFVRAEQREKLAAGHTGTGHVWATNRDDWDARRARDRLGE